MSNMFLGEIKSFPFNYAPAGWAFCDGQLLSIEQNSDLFNLLGTTYGGDGRTTFGLPDLRGRAAVDAGQGPGLPNVQMGQKQGGGTVKVDIVPSGGQEIEYSQPALGVHYAIALEGEYPQRN